MIQVKKTHSEKSNKYTNANATLTLSKPIALDNCTALADCITKTKSNIEIDNTQDFDLGFEVQYIRV